MFIKPAQKTTKLKEKNVIGGSDLYQNYPVNLLFCSSIIDEPYTISGHQYHSIYFKGIDCRWLYIKEADRDEELGKIFSLIFS